MLMKSAENTEFGIEIKIVFHVTVRKDCCQSCIFLMRNSKGIEIFCMFHYCGMITLYISVYHSIYLCVICAEKIFGEKFSIYQ